MTAAFNELPLALFTTFASIGAGAFIALAVAFFTTSFSGEQLKKIDKLTLVPAIVVIVGFIAAFFHLANPAAAFGVFAGIGRSPLSNELCVACLFAVVMIVYVIMALTGKLGGARKGLAAVLAVLAVVFAAFMGMAYSIPTVPTWSTPWPIIQMLGYALLGGVALGVCVIAFAGALPEAAKSSFKGAGIAIAVIGLVLAVAGLGMMAAGASDVNNAVASGANLVSGAMVSLVVAIACLVAACAAVFMALRGASGTALAAVAAVLACVGVLAGRLVFYALQISVGIYF